MSCLFTLTNNQPYVILAELTLLSEGSTRIVNNVIVDSKKNAISNKLYEFEAFFPGGKLFVKNGDRLPLLWKG